MLPVEENTVEFLLTLGRSGGGEERRDERIHWTIGGSPIAYHNCVVRADLSSDDADEAIVASQDAMRARGVPGSWHVGQAMSPDDIGERLRAHGFEGGPEPAMTADLDTTLAFTVPDGLTISPVVDRKGLEAYESVLAGGFGEGPTEAAWVRAMYERIGIADDAWQHFVGASDGTAVATASLFFAAGVAGIYFVATAPDVRRRGIGTAITGAAMHAARELGFRTAVLGSSPVGQSVYERLGFRTVFVGEVYEWSPR